MKLLDKVNEFENEIESVEDVSSETHMTQPIDRLKPYKGALIILLTIIKIFTGKKADKKIDALIDILGSVL